MTDEAKFIFDQLRAEGYPLLITRQQYARIMGISLSTLDNYMARGYGLPNYKKMGSNKNARVLFNLRDVAEFIAAQTVKTA